MNIKLIKMIQPEATLSLLNDTWKILKKIFLLFKFIILDPNTTLRITLGIHMYESGGNKATKRQF
jgi:hypothetical protein